MFPMLLYQTVTYKEMYLRVLCHGICLEYKATLQNWMNMEGKHTETLCVRLKLVLTHTAGRVGSSITGFFSSQSSDFQNIVKLDGKWCPLHSSTTIKPTNDPAAQHIQVLLLDVNRMLCVCQLLKVAIIRPYIKK